MRVLKLVLICSFIYLSSWAQKPVSIQIDAGKVYQEIHGFGASDAWRCQFVGENWPLEKRQQIADLLFSRDFDKKGNPLGIGLSIWRFYIGSGSTEQGDSSLIKDVWRRAECFQRPDGTYDWDKQAGQQWFLQAAKKKGVEKFLAFTICPPVHMTLNGKAFNGRNAFTLNIREEELPAYADFLTDVVEHFEKEEGIHFDYLSPFNEPQWKWERGTQEGTPATNGDLYALTKLLSERLEARRLSTEILLGEAGQIQYLYQDMNDHGNDRQIRAFFDERSKMNITSLSNVRRAITGHSYFTTWPVKKMIADRQALYDTLQAVDPALEYWQTEFCILQKNEDIGGGRPRDLGMNTALYFARVIHHDLVIAHASSWQFWTALSESDYKDGLVYIDNGDNGVRGHNDPDSKILQNDGFVRDSKTLWALGNYARFIRPGMKRVDVQYKNETLSLDSIARDLMVSGYTDERTGKIVLVAVNYSNEEKTLMVNAGRIKRNRFQTFTTSAEKDLAPGQSPADKVSIPARAVVTMVGAWKG